MTQNKITADAVDVYVERNDVEAADTYNAEINKINLHIPDIFSIDVGSNDSEIDTDPTLGIPCREKLEEIISQSYTDSQIDIEPYEYEMKIHLTSDVPFHCAPRRLSFAERTTVQDIVNDLESRGIIRPSNSPYASAIVLVKKKSGQTRLCVDYRGLNKITVRDNYPLPLIDDCVEYLEGKKVFSVLDLKNGFHQVQVSPDSIKYTSFVTLGGQYEFLKMPFGLKMPLPFSSGSLTISLVTLSKLERL